MRKQFIPILLSFVCLSCSALAQDIANSIKNYEPSKSDIISRGRNLLLDSYVAGDLDKVTEAYLYLNNKVADSNYAVFSPFEQIYLGALTKNYACSLHEILRMDSISRLDPSIRRKSPIAPNNDQLSRNLAENSFIYLQNIYKNIDTSTLPAEDKSMLTLILNDIFKDNNPRVSQDIKDKVQNDINRQCDLFLGSYPQSKYEHYVRNYVRYAVERSDWGFGMDFSIGYVNAGAKSNYVKDGFAAGFGWDFHHKKLGLFTRINILGTTTKKDFYFTPSVILPPKSSVTYFVPELSLGYETLNNKTLTLMPFTGIGGFFCDPGQKDQDNHIRLRNKELNSFCYQVGVNCDFKFKNSKTNPFLRNEYSYNAIRLRVTYLMPTSDRPELRGNQLMVTVGWGLVGYGKKRSW
ncbi:MAG: hypothetical protein Q8904_09680 [Bacteroidota bacterium]|nr:hypothetical protein [Bacteroidota bacterium]